MNMAPLGEFLFYKETEMKKMFFIFVVLFFYWQAVRRIIFGMYKGEL